MKKVTWLRTLVTVVLSVTVVSMVYVFTKGWPLMRPPRMEDIKEVTMTDTESGIKKEFVDEMCIRDRYKYRRRKKHTVCLFRKK